MISGRALNWSPIFLFSRLSSVKLAFRQRSCCLSISRFNRNRSINSNCSSGCELSFGKFASCKSASAWLLSCEFQRVRLNAFSCDLIVEPDIAAFSRFENSFSIFPISRRFNSGFLRFCAYRLISATEITKGTSLLTKLTLPKAVQVLSLMNISKLRSKTVKDVLAADKISVRCSSLLFMNCCWLVFACYIRLNVKS